MNTFERVCHIIEMHTGREDIALTDSLADLGADSLDVISISLDIERQFDIRIPDDHEINTVEDAVSFIEDHA